MSNYLGGIGKHRVLIKYDGITRFDYTFPLCQNGGFIPNYTPDIKVSNYITLDVNNPVKTKKVFSYGVWGSWLLDYSEFALGTTEAQKAIDFINLCLGSERNYGVLEIYFQPNIDDSKWYIVNNLLEPIEPRASIASEQSAGTIGIKIRLEVVEILNNINIGIATGYQVITQVNNESIKIILNR